MSRLEEAEPLMPREGSRASSLDEEEAAEISPRRPSTTEPEVDSNLLRRAGRIFAFGVVATVIILLGVVGTFGQDAVTRVKLGVPHEGMAVGNVVHGPDGALAHREVQPSFSDEDAALSPEQRERRDLVRTQRQAIREASRRRRQWDRRDGGSDDVERDDQSAQAASVQNKAASLGQAPSDASVNGVSLNGWLQLEEWFFSNDKSSIVDATDGMTQGVVFPPVFPTPESLGFEWASEGDLASKLAESVGEEQTVAAFVAHREQYFTDADVTGLQKQGYTNVRLPLTWAAFASEEDEPEKLITDPAHPNVKQVTISRASLNKYVDTLASAGLKIVIDVHTMPGGSSQGTYNGVFPNPPTFWDTETLMTIGRGVTREMLRWYLALPDVSKNAISGLTLLNEPAHLLPDKKDIMLSWYAGAVDDYRKLVVAPAVAQNKAPPNLLVNFIDTCGMNVYNMAEWMAGNFQPEELKTWAVLDTHMYLAWEHPAPGTWTCDTPVDEIKSGIFNFMSAKVSEMKDAAERNGIAHTAVSEWSLATHHNSSVGCQDTHVLEALRDAQVSAFTQANVESYFWGWKMPDAGKHQKFWSAQFHDEAFTAVAGEAAAVDEADAVEPEATQATGVAEGVSEEVSEVLQASTDADAAAKAQVDADIETLAAAAETAVDAEDSVKSEGAEGADVDANAAANAEDAEPNAEDAEPVASDEPATGSTTEIPDGYVAMSVDPSSQGDGHVSEMRAVADRAEAEVRAAADMLVAAQEVKKATAAARAAAAGGAAGDVVDAAADATVDETESLDALASEAAESLEVALEPIEVAPVEVAVDPVATTQVTRSSVGRNSVIRV